MNQTPGEGREAFDTSSFAPNHIWSTDGADSAVAGIHKIGDEDTVPSDAHIGARPMIERSAQSLFALRSRLGNFSPIYWKLMVLTILKIPYLMEP